MRMPNGIGEVEKTNPEVADLLKVLKERIDNIQSDVVKKQKSQIIINQTLSNRLEKIEKRGK